MPILYSVMVFWLMRYIKSIVSPIRPRHRGVCIQMFVGNNLLGRSGLNANVGLITEGYVSLGWLGVFIHSIAISFIFLFFNSLRIDPKYFGIFIVYVYYMNTAFFGTLLLTHGLFFLIIFSFFCLRRHPKE